MLKRGEEGMRGGFWDVEIGGTRRESCLSHIFHYTGGQGNLENILVEGLPGVNRVVRSDRTARIGCAVGRVSLCGGVDAFTFGASM